MSSFISQPWLLKRPLPAPSLDLNFLATTLDSRITFTRAAGPATYFNAAGTIQTAGTNVPRFDCDPVTHAPRGLLIEEARTNLLLNSATLSTQSVTVTAQAYTLSFYGTGTVTLSGTSTAGPLTGTGAFPARVALTFTPTAGTLTCTVTGSVLNANLEAGAFATSYVTTTGASATRAADVVTMVLPVPFTAAAGTLASEVLMPQVTLPAQHLSFGEIDDGTGANVFDLRNGAASSQVGMIVFSGGSNAGTVSNGTVLAGVPLKAAASWTYSPVNVTVGLNGAAPTSGAPSPLPVGAMSRLSWGAARGDPVNGYLRRTRYWSRALSLAELRGATL